MILKKEQCASLLEAARPLIKWMNENCDPYCEAKVDQTSVELLESSTRQITGEFTD